MPATRDGLRRAEALFEHLDHLRHAQKSSNEDPVTVRIGDYCREPVQIRNPAFVSAVHAIVRGQVDESIVAVCAELRGLGFDA